MTRSRQKPGHRHIRLILTMTFAVTIPAALFAQQDDFRPVSPAELVLQENPKDPSASTMILELSETHDDTKGIETRYERIKVFKVQDKGIADIEVPNVKKYFTVSDIKARTIHADGSIVPFTGQPYEKVLVQARGVKITQKIVTLPDVEPGSVLEYVIKMKYPHYLSCWTTWYLEHPAFVLKETFTLLTKDNARCESRLLNVPGGKQVDNTKGVFSLELDNVPAFENELYAPPAQEITPRVEFFDNSFGFRSPGLYWNQFAARTTLMMEEYIGKRKAIQEAAASIVSASDAPMVKLRKIRDHLQDFHNISWDTSKTQQEEKREKLKDNNNIEDVWKHQYGTQLQIAALYVGLARAAGIETNLVTVSSRKEVFFNRDLPDSNQLPEVAVVAHIDGKPVYIDPATPFCPFGLMPWEETGVVGIELVSNPDDKRSSLPFLSGKAEFITTPPSDSKQAVIHRRADLHLDGEVFKGTVELSFTGLEAMRWRLEDRAADEGQQRTRYEDELKALLPAGATATVSKISNPKETELPLTVDFDIEIPGLTSTAGKRILLPASVFHGSDQNAFAHEHRVHPIYFSYPYQELDDVRWAVPQDYKVEFLPARHQEQTPFGYFDVVSVREGNAIHTQRRFALFGIYFPVTNYPALRDFFQKVHAGDQETMALQSTAPAAVTSQR